MPWETVAPLKDSAELVPLWDWTVEPEVSTACSPLVLSEVTSQMLLTTDRSLAVSEAPAPGLPFPSPCDLQKELASPPAAALRAAGPQCPPASGPSGGHWLLQPLSGRPDVGLGAGSEKAPPSGLQVLGTCGEPTPSYLPPSPRAWQGGAGSTGGRVPGGLRPTQAPSAQGHALSPLRTLLPGGLGEPPAP